MTFDNIKEVRQIEDDIERYKSYLKRNLSHKSRKFFEAGIKNLKKRLKYYR